MIKNLVSIIVPTYNDAHHLKKSLDDLYNQTYKNYEVIIINDGSTDNTEEILINYCKDKPKFKYYNKENGGTGSALNYGFSKSQGEFATWCSSDDSKRPNMVESLVNFLKENRDIEYVVSAYKSQLLNRTIRSYIPDTSGKGYRHLDFYALHNNILSNSSYAVDDWVSINRKQCYQGTNFMFTMRLKEECGDFLEIPGEDYYMAAKMGMRSRTGYIDTVLGTHNNPPDSLSSMDPACVVGANLMTWELIDKEYKHWHLSKIPKEAHFYWGSNNMSFLRYLSLYSFKKLNPDWSIKLYVPKTVNNTLFWRDTIHKCDLSDYNGNTDYTDKISTLPIQVIEVDFSKMFKGKEISEVHKSDFLRWYLLYHKGGVWCDMDILFTKSMTEMSINKKENKNLDCSINMSDQHAVRIGLMLSSKCKNPFFGQIMREAKNILMENNDKLLYQSIGSDLVNNIIRTSPTINNSPTKMKMSYTTLNGYNWDLQVDNFPSHEFYFHDHTKIHKIFNENCFFESDKYSIGIHWYGGSPISQEANNILSKENYSSFDTTISKAIKKVLI